MTSKVVYRKILLLLVVVILTLSHARVSAQDDQEIQGKFGTSEWTIDNNGVLTISEGELSESSGLYHVSHWEEYKTIITKIVIEEGVVLNMDSQHLFRGLSEVETIEGLEWLNTEHVTSMNYMFCGMSKVQELDVAHFKMENVADMGFMFYGVSEVEYIDVSNWRTDSLYQAQWMFAGASSLKAIDISNWDMTSLIYLENMFLGATSLRELTLGEKTMFQGLDKNVGLEPVLENEQFTGYWQNVGDGTPSEPKGEFVFTSQELMNSFNGEMADKYVYQPRPELGKIELIIVGDGDATSSVGYNAGLKNIIATLTASERESANDVFKGWIVVSNNLELEGESTGKEVSFVKGTEDVKIIAVFGPSNGILFGNYLYTSDDTELKLSDVISWSPDRLAEEILERVNLRRLDVINGTDYENYTEVIFSIDEISPSAGNYVVEFKLDNVKRKSLVVTSSTVVIVDDTLITLVPTNTDIPKTSVDNIPVEYLLLFSGFVLVIMVSSTKKEKMN